MNSDDDETPTGPPPPPASADARALVDVELALLQLGAESGRIAALVDEVAGADRPDLLSLYRRRVLEVRDELDELARLLPAV